MAEEIDSTINNEDQLALDQDDSSQSEDELTKVDEADKADETTEEDKYKDVPFDKHPRWAELKSELSEVKAISATQATELASLKTLVSSRATNEQKDEAWEKIKKIDAEGFSSYEELTKSILDVVKNDQTKEAAKQAESFEESRQANIQQMQTDLKMMADTGLLANEEQEDFIEWCATKLEETTDKDHPQGNVKVYADLQRALSHYRHSQASTSSKTDEKKRLDRSKIGSSGTSETQTTKLSAADVRAMDWKDVKFS